MPGDWAGRLAPAFELIFHFNRQARKPNKIVPCKTAGEIGHAPGTAGMRRKDGSFNTWTHGGEATQPFRIPDSVIRIERHHGAVGTDLSHPAPFPVKLVEHVMRAFSDEGEIVYEPFGGSGTSLIAGERIGRQVRAIELAPNTRRLHPALAAAVPGQAPAPRRRRPDVRGCQGGTREACRLIIPLRTSDQASLAATRVETRPLRDPGFPSGPVVAFSCDPLMSRPGRGRAGPDGDPRCRF